MVNAGVGRREEGERNEKVDDLAIYQHSEWK